MSHALNLHSPVSVCALVRLLLDRYDYTNLMLNFLKGEFAEKEASGSPRPANAAASRFSDVLGSAVFAGTDSDESMPGLASRDSTLLANLGSNIMLFS